MILHYNEEKKQKTIGCQIKIIVINFVKSNPFNVKNK